MNKTRELIKGFIGPMYASKTLALIHHIGASEAMGLNPIVVKPSIDNRFAQNEIRSRSGACHEALAIPIETPELIYDLIEKSPNRIDLVAIDEAQFFHPKLGQVVQTLSRNQIEVAYSALNTDYRGNPFPTMQELMPLSSQIEMYYARCMYSNGNGRRCGVQAEMTQRLVNGQPDSYLSPTVVIDTQGKTEVTYQARCLQHWQLTDMPEVRSLKN